MELTQDQLMAVAYLFEQSCGNPLSSMQQEVIEAARLENQDPIFLTRVLVDTLDTAQSDEFRSLAYWCLGKKYERSMISQFRLYLQKELATMSSGPIYQIMIALDNLEEPIFNPVREGFSADETELNQADSQAYLEKVKDQFPAGAP